MSDSDQQVKGDGEQQAEGELSPIVTELLTIMGEAPDPVFPQPTAPLKPALTNRPSNNSRSLDRQTLKDDYNTNYAQGPVGATTAQQAMLATLRLKFVNALDLDPKDEESRIIVGETYDAIAQEYQATRVQVTRVTAKRNQLNAALDQALAQERKPLVEGTTVEDAKSLYDRRDKIAEELTAPGDKQPGHAFSDIEAQAEKIIELHHDVQAFIELETLRKSVSNQLDKAIAPKASTPNEIVPRANDDDVKPLIEERDQIRLALSEKSATLTILQNLQPRIGSIENKIALLPDVIEQRYERKRQIEAEIATTRKNIQQILGADPSWIEDKAQKIEKALALEPLTDGTLKTAAGFLPDLIENFDSARQDALDRIATAAELKPQVEKLLSLAGDNCDGFTEIASIRKQLNEILKKLTNIAKEYEYDLLEVPDLLIEIRKSITDGGQKMVRSRNFKKDQINSVMAYLIASREAAAKEAAELGELLDDDTIVETVQELDEQITELTKKQNPETLGQAFDRLFAMQGEIINAREDGARDLEQRASQRKRLLQVVGADDPVPLPSNCKPILANDRQAVKTPLGDKMSTDITPEVIEQARANTTIFEQDFTIATSISKIWNEEAFKSIHAKARQPMQKELDKTRSTVLAATGMVAALDRCTRLDGLLKQAKAEESKAISAKDAIGKVRIESTKIDPSVAGEIYDIVGPDAISGLGEKEMQTLCACFTGSGSDRTALRDLVGEAFGAQSKVLVKLLRSGDKDTVLALAHGFANKDDRARLRGLIVDGGIGDVPEVLDDLLSQGVSAEKETGKANKRTANVERLKNLGKSFGDDEGPKRMKTLVGECGFGKSRPEINPPRPGVFAEVLDGAFDGDTDKLRGLANEFSGDQQSDATDRNRLKGLIENGGFGNQPKAFAPLLKKMSEGGVAGGATKLKAMGTEFRAPVDRDNLKRVLASGGISGDTKAPNGTEDPARKHEHADTLAKVYDDGFGQDPAKLAKFARAFGDSDDHARQCKGMMTAWNEYGDTHAGKRQPGEQINKLLQPRKLGTGGIADLQTTFTAKMDAIPDENKRKLAMRFAPHFDKKGASLNKTWLSGDGLSTDMTDVGVQGVESYPLKRHTPEFFDKAKMTNSHGITPPNHSQFPPGTDMKALISDVLRQIGPNPERQNNDKLIVNVGNPKLLVQIGFCRGSHNELLVNHITPWKPVPRPANGRVASPQPPDPSEIGDFSTNEMNRLLESIKQ